MFGSFKLPTSPASPTEGESSGDATLGILFVCTANICRSAYAEVMARHLFGDQFAEQVGEWGHSGQSGRLWRPEQPAGHLRFFSAGTWGFDRKPMCPEMAQQAEARGADASWFRSERVTRELIAGADLVLAAGTDHVSFLVDEWPGEFKKIFTFGQFVDVISDADPEVSGRELLDFAQANRRPALVRDNLPDPYRRGASAAAASAELIDGMLEAIIPRLVP